MSNGTLLNIFVIVNIIMFVVTPSVCFAIIEDEHIDNNRVNPNTGLPGSMYDAIRTSPSKVRTDDARTIYLDVQKTNSDFQSHSLYDEYKKVLDKYTNIELNDKTSASTIELRWAENQPLRHRIQKSAIGKDNNFTNGHGQYDRVYEEFKRRLDDLKSTYTAKNKVRCVEYDLKKQASDGSLNSALKDLQEHSILPQTNVNVENTKIVKKKHEKSNGWKEFQNDLKQKLKKKREQFMEAPKCVDSLYDEFKKRLDVYTADPSLSAENPSDPASPKYADDTPIYSKPEQYEIQRIQNSLQPNGIREKFYEEYRRNQHKAATELYNKDNGWSERGTRNNQPHVKSHPTTVKAKKSVPIVSNGLFHTEDSSYPAVLTKALESSLNPYAGVMPKSLLTTAAQNMHTTPLDLAKKLTSNPVDLNLPDIHNNAGTSELLQKAPTAQLPAQVPSAAIPQQQPQPIPMSSVGSQYVPAADPNTLQTFVDSSQFQEQQTPQSPDPNCVPTVQSAPSQLPPNISDILQKLLMKLESMQNEKTSTVENVHPEGAPCEVIGSWNSLAMGLRFVIQTGKNPDRTLASVENGNTLLNIEAVERMPTRPHSILDTDWCFMGSAVKTLGGPFYIYTQSPQDREIATFAGYCRTCGGIDTIFGSWTLLSPSNDCQDITASVENRRDIMRRYGMGQKRKERYKDILYNRSHMARAMPSSSPKCCRLKLS